MFISLRLFTIVNELMFSRVIQVFFAPNTDHPHHDQYAEYHEAIRQAVRDGCVFAGCAKPAVLQKFLCFG